MILGQQRISFFCSMGWLRNHYGKLLGYYDDDDDDDDDDDEDAH